MAAPLVDRNTGDVIPAADHNDVKAYVEDGTYRVKTAHLELVPGTEPTAAKGVFYYDSTDDLFYGCTDGSTFEEIGGGYTFSTGLSESEGTVTTNDSEINHNSLNNYSVDQHRTINDSGTDVTDLWSGSKINTELGGKVSTSGDTMTGSLNLVAGTTTVAPLKMSSGTNLTTPVAGVFEYDGTDLFFTVG